MLDNFQTHCAAVGSSVLKKFNQAFFLKSFNAKTIATYTLNNHVEPTLLSKIVLMQYTMSSAKYFC